MSLSAQAQNRELFTKLLNLSQAQIAALHADDMPEFDKILRDKHYLIVALAEARAMIDADPPLEEVAAQINESEKNAQRVLGARIDQIRLEMTGLRQRTKVRAAYSSSTPLAPRARMMTSADTARFMDRKL